MDKIFSIIALSCILSIVYQTRVLPYNGSFLGFVMTAVMGFFALVLSYKLLKIAFIRLSKLAIQAKKVIQTIPQRLNAQRTAMIFLLQKNTRLQLEIESLKADLNESTNELKTLVNNWSPNVTKSGPKAISTLSIKPVSQDLHEYEFIENAVKNSNVQNKSQEAEEQTSFDL